MYNHVIKQKAVNESTIVLFKQHIDDKKFPNLSTSSPCRPYGTWVISSSSRTTPFCCCSCCNHKSFKACYTILFYLKKKKKICINFTENGLTEIIIQRNYEHITTGDRLANSTGAIILTKLSPSSSFLSKNKQSPLTFSLSFLFQYFLSTKQKTIKSPYSQRRVLNCNITKFPIFHFTIMLNTLIYRNLNTH
jgi:hypothetical protein